MTDQVEISQEVIDEAKAQGWVEQDQYRGNPKEWVDAKSFVERGRQINPILRKHNKELMKELDIAKKQAQEAIDAAKEFREFQKEAFEHKKKELESQINQLKVAKREAISQGDGDRAVALDDAIDDLRDEKANLKQPTEPKKEEPIAGIDPELQSWMERNVWYGQEDEDTELTNALAATIRRKNPTLVGRSFLDELDKRLEERNVVKKRNRPTSPVEGVVSEKPVYSQGKNKFSDLPEEAKAAYERFKKQGLFKSQEEYLALYQW